MQDVEAELSDPTRIHEFVEAYETAPLTEDERFLLMGIILNSFEFGEIEPAAHPNWDQALALLDRDFGVNRFHVESFSEPGWRIAAFMHALAERKSPSGGSTDAA